MYELRELAASRRMEVIIPMANSLNGQHGSFAGSNNITLCLVENEQAAALLFELVLVLRALSSPTSSALRFFGVLKSSAFCGLAILGDVFCFLL